MNYVPGSFIHQQYSNSEKRPRQALMELLHGGERHNKQNPRCQVLMSLVKTNRERHRGREGAGSTTY